jgi:hypothetical protein
VTKEEGGSRRQAQADFFTRRKRRGELRRENFSRKKAQKSQKRNEKPLKIPGSCKPPDCDKSSAECPNNRTTSAPGRRTSRSRKCAVDPSEPPYRDVESSTFSAKSSKPLNNPGFWRRLRSCRMIPPKRLHHRSACGPIHSRMSSVFKYPRWHDNPAK